MEVSHPLTNAIKSVKSFCNARLKCKRSQRDWTRKNQKQPSRLSDIEQKRKRGEQTAHKVSLLQIQVMKFQGYRDNLKAVGDSKNCRYGNAPDSWAGSENLKSPIDAVSACSYLLYDEDFDETCPAEEKLWLQ